jgi:hypothetical protein
MFRAAAPRTTVAKRATVSCLATSSALSRTITPVQFTKALHMQQMQQLAANSPSRILNGRRSAEDTLHHQR